MEEEIAPDGCLELLQRTSVGRIAGVTAGRPFVFLVNYAMDGDRIVFRTAPGTKLAGSSFDRVAFEIDGINPDDESGWSVVVQGLASDVSEMLDSRSAGMRDLELHPWAPGEKAHWVAIEPETITGRRIRRETRG